MTRYSPKHWGYLGIANFQIWNEPNIATFWTGSPKQLGQLIRTAHDIRNKVNPKAKVIAPSMVARLSYQQRWIKSFYRISLGGRPVWKYVDAAAFSMYPVDTYPVDPSKPLGATRPATPEDSMRILAQVRALLRQDKVRASLPIWNTEINYGMRRHLPGVPTIGVRMSLDRQLAWVLRTYLLGWSNGIRRTYWYDWSAAPLLGIKMTGRNGETSAAGIAFSRIRLWMNGRVAPCRSTGGRYGLYTGTIDYGQGLRGRVQWSPGHRTVVRAPRGTTGMVNTRGTVRTMKRGARVRLGEAPVLFRYRV